MRAIGVAALKRHLDGKSLMLDEMVLAKCAECMAKYADGCFDCEIPTCPLYPLMPYKGRHQVIRVDE